MNHLLNREKNKKGPFKMTLFHSFTLLDYFLQPAIIFQTIALKAAPTKGPTMNIHNCCKASPPWKRAGPMLRAGFTDVPVYLIHTR